MNLTDRVTAPQQVTARTVGDETVIRDIASGTYFGLDLVGARIWELMGEGRTLSSVCDIMPQEYDVQREDLEQDTVRLAQDLARRGLVNKSD